MKHTITTVPRNSSELEQLCASVRAFVTEGAYEACIEPICKAMERHPHAPQPHNLLGIILEKLGDHLTAMKHFRAAWALDPTYEPANHNLSTYGTFRSMGSCAFDESDLPSAAPGNRDRKKLPGSNGQGVCKTMVEYDIYGIGHVVWR